MYAVAGLIKNLPDVLTHGCTGKYIFHTNELQD